MDSESGHRSLGIEEGQESGSKNHLEERFLLKMSSSVFIYYSSLSVWPDAVDLQRSANGLHHYVTSWQRSGENLNAYLKVQKTQHCKSTMLQ